MCVCVCVCVCVCGLGNGGDGVMPFYAWKTIHPGKFNGVMEVAAIQMGGVYIRYTP